MASKKHPVNFVNSVETFVNPTQCLNKIVHAWTEYLRIAEEEKTERRKIKAWEKVTLAEIRVKHDFLINYLKHSFDERAENFQSLFQLVDRAMSAGDNQELGLALKAIVDLAKSNPFKNLADLSNVNAALNDPNHVWEF